MRSLAVAVVLTLLVLPLPARAQVEQAFQSWSMVMVSGRLDPSSETGAAVWFDGQARQGPAGTQLLIRPGVGWFVTPRWSIWGGYLLTPTFADGGSPRIEQRAWQQAQGVLFSGPSTQIASRTRLEQRMLNTQPGAGLRLRQLVRAQQTLHGDLSGVLWDELFFALNETAWTGPAGFDANRWFAGLAWAPTGRRSEAPTAKARVEAGYLGHIVPRTGAPTRISHALSWNLFVSW